MARSSRCISQPYLEFLHSSHPIGVYLIAENAASWPTSWQSRMGPPVASSSRTTWTLNSGLRVRRFIMVITPLLEYYPELSQLSDLGGSLLHQSIRLDHATIPHFDDGLCQRKPPFEPHFLALISLPSLSTASRGATNSSLENLMLSRMPFSSRFALWPWRPDKHAMCSVILTSTSRCAASLPKGLTHGSLLTSFMQAVIESS